MKATHFKIIGLKPITPPKIDEIYYAQDIQKGLMGINDWLYIFKGFKVENNNSAIFISDKETKRDYSLYDSSNLKISVGAIVGRNGAGKSSFVELMVRIINNLSAVLLGERFNFAKAEHLHYIDHVYGELLVQIENKFTIISVKGRDLNLFWYCQSKNTLIYKLSSIDNLLEDEGNKTYPRLDVLNGFKKGRNILRKLFYTIVFNYSLYGFNYRDFEREKTPLERIVNLKKIEDYQIKEEFSSWLSGIFHKNDGYQTPLVLHPMRIGGQLDIIRENKLAKDRLISLLFYRDNEGNFPLRTINEDLKVTKLIISDADDKYSRERMLDTLSIKKNWNVYKNFNSIYNDIYLFWDNNFNIRKAVNSPYYHKATDYIVYKTLKIIHTYKKYFSIYKYLSQHNYDSIKLYGLLDQLLKDYTHITKKLRQTINFLINPLFNAQESEINLETFDKVPKVISNNRTELFLSNKPENYLPPPIFNIDLGLEKLFNSKKDFPYIEVPFSGLSSGERQIAYTISNILYHLTNIDSEWDDPYKGKGQHAIIKYKFINIILDEIELYFHPEMQRQFVFLITNMLQCVKFKHLKGINILFVTHSPFILSDIPSENVLVLNNNHRNDSNFAKSDIKYLDDTTFTSTFGANIMEMLSNTFFMHSSIGESVNRELNKLVRCHIDIVRENKRDFDYYKNNKKRFIFLQKKIADSFWKKLCEDMIIQIEKKIKDTKS